MDGNNHLSNMRITKSYVRRILVLNVTPHSKMVFGAFEILKEGI